MKGQSYLIDLKLESNKFNWKRQNKNNINILGNTNSIITQKSPPISSAATALNLIEHEFFIAFAFEPEPSHFRLSLSHTIYIFFCSNNSYHVSYQSSSSWPETSAHSYTLHYFILRNIFINFFISCFKNVPGFFYFVCHSFCFLLFFVKCF